MGNANNLASRFNGFGTPHAEFISWEFHLLDGSQPLSLAPDFSQVIGNANNLANRFNGFSRTSLYSNAHHMIERGESTLRKELCDMSLHSYSRCWLHLIWTTLDREPMLTKPAAVKGSGFLNSYAKEKGIYMKINYFNAEHVHALIDLPTNMAIEDVVKLLKGSSSHWINENRLLRGKFSWGRGYGAFSVSHSQVNRVASYIAGQKEHHHKKTFNEEFELFVKRYGLEWREEGNR